MKPQIFKLENVSVGYVRVTRESPSHLEAAIGDCLISIDLDKLAALLAPKAARNKSKKAKLAHGDIVLSVYNIRERETDE